MEPREICVLKKWKGRNRCIVLSSVVLVTLHELLARIIAWVCKLGEPRLGCLRNRILSPQHVRPQLKNQIRQNLCDLSRRQNPVAEKKIFSQKFSCTHEAICRCDVSPQRVASTSRPTCTHGVICDLSPRRVAATCRLVCSDL